MYLVISALEELSNPAIENHASRLDFGGGEGEWKAILSNYSWSEASVHIFAPTLKGVCLNAFRSLSAATNLIIRGAIGRLKLTTRIRKLLRKAS